MKQFKFKVISLLLCMLTMVVTGCKDEEEAIFNADEQESVGLTVSSKGIMIDRNGGTATITVSSEYYWNIYGGADWCELSSNSGNPGETCEITITAGKNEGATARYVTLYARSGFDKIDISVLQPGANYVEPDQTEMETDIFDLIYSITNGWNLGNTMEAWVSWDLNNEAFGTGESMETAWGNPAATQELIDCVYEHGFRGIRIPCKWDVYYMDMKDPAAVDYKIHPNWFKRMREVVDYCMKYPDLKVLMNTHNGDWDRACMEDSVSKYEPILFKVWTQIAENFRDYDERLMFGAADVWYGERAWGGNGGTMRGAVQIRAGKYQRDTEYRRKKRPSCHCVSGSQYEFRTVAFDHEDAGRLHCRPLGHGSPFLCTFYILYARRRFVGICSLFLGKQLFARTGKRHRPQFVL